MSSTQSPPIIDELFHMPLVAPKQIDTLWANGWRHFGTRFFRYNVMQFGGEWQSVLALRTDLATFVPSKSQRRTLKKNADLQVIVRPVVIDDEKITLFEKHKLRFKEYVPNTIYTFLSRYPDHIPCRCVELCAYDEDRLLAVAFLDLGMESVSSVYAMFDPEESGRRLGIYTMLLEIEYAIQTERTWYYSGYTTVGHSHYDYKKRFHALECFDFVSGWKPFEKQ